MKILAILLIFLPGLALAESTAPPTLGGWQIWSDVDAHAGWRIQENLLTGHFRLLDDDNGQQALGSLAQCQQKLNQQKQTHDLAWSSDHLVIMIHGLGRGHQSWNRVSKHLQAQGYATLAVSYGSTRGDTMDHATRLTGLIANLDGINRLSFVTHSYGGLVLRQTLALDNMQDHLPKVNAAVLLGPPSNGAALADHLQDNPLFEWIAGDGGQSVTSAAARTLPGLPVPFGIIAGGKGDKAGYNPLVAGDDDGIVAVSEARMEGTDHFLLIPAFHTVLMKKPGAIRAILTFLEHHHF